MEGVLPWHNGGVYVFKDTQNWFFSHSSQSIGVLSSYPKSIMQWWSDELELTGYTALKYVLLLTFPGLKEVGKKVHHKTRSWLAGGQADSQRDRQGDSQADRQTVSQTDRKEDRHANRQTDRQTLQTGQSVVE